MLRGCTRLLGHRGRAVLFGLSGGAIDAALNSYAAGHFGARQINLMHAAYGVGAAASPLIVTVAVSTGTSWRWAYLVVMVIQVVLAVIFAASSRRWNEAVKAQDSPESPSASSGRARRWRPPPRAVIGLLVVTVESGLESVVGLWAFVFLLQDVAIQPAMAGVVVSGYWAALVVGRVLLGSVADRVGTWPVLAIASPAAVVAAAFLLSRQPVLSAAGVVLLGLTLAPIYPLLVLTTTERTEVRSVDRLVGFQGAADTLGSIAFASLAGLVMGADLTVFVYCVLALALLTTGGIWVLKPGK